MFADLDQKRTTEVDDINGVVVRLADKHGLGAPVNEAVAALVRFAEKEKQGCPNLTSDEILEKLCLTCVGLRPARRYGWGARFFLSLAVLVIAAAAAALVAR